MLRILYCIRWNTSINISLIARTPSYIYIYNRDGILKFIYITRERVDRLKLLITAYIVKRVNTSKNNCCYQYAQFCPEYN